MTQKVICSKCKDEVMKVIEDHLQEKQKEIARLSLSLLSDDLVNCLTEQLIQIGAKSVKYRVGDMFVNDKK